MSKRMLIRDILTKSMNKLDDYNTYKLYYNPMANTLLTYPCILYKRNSIRQRHADNFGYHSYEEYQITIIDKRVDSPIIDVLLQNQYCRYSNEYISDNMHHTILIINTGGLANG